jgi:hypothetical protein
MKHFLLWELRICDEKYVGRMKLAFPDRGGVERQKEEIVSI